ncbi:MAG: sulfatase [Akkermansiaceae bacterium]|jgi:arylsulfatase A-like enzyme|nr:sulfatase [Akkermansiaceae bacterium]
MKALLLLALFAIPTAAGQRPNVVVILADDLGWRDVGFAGNRDIDTPQLDALAKRGSVFSEACASAPNCAPTRACLMTGQYPPRHGIYTVIDDRHAPGSPWHKVIAAQSRAELGPEAVTIADRLRDAGYATGMVGMWNLGRGRRGPGAPAGRGFDFSRQPKELGFENDRYRDEQGRDLTEVMAGECVSFIRSNKDRPWFLYFAPHAVHAPYEPEPELLEKYRRRGSPNPEFAATVEALDRAVGLVIEEIDSAGLAENTLIIFFSDNGGEAAFTAPLRGHKGSLYQGGLRVPMLVAGPGVRAGFTCGTPVVTMDVLPTVLDFAGIPPAEVDGVSLRPILTGEGELPARDLFWHFPCYTGRFGPAGAIRHGDFKLVENLETGAIEFFNLARDPAEERNLATVDPAAASNLLSRLKAWRRAIGAAMPQTPNPAYDPEARPQRGREHAKPNRPTKPVR